MEYLWNIMGIPMEYLWYNDWLVVYLPLWKKSSSMGMMTFAIIIWENKPVMFQSPPTDCNPSGVLMSVSSLSWSEIGDSKLHPTDRLIVYLQWLLGTSMAGECRGYTPISIFVWLQTKLKHEILLKELQASVDVDRIWGLLNTDLLHTIYFNYTFHHYGMFSSPVLEPPYFEIHVPCLEHLIGVVLDLARMCQGY